MNSWQRWLQAPQTHLFRRALFQIHLWLGIGLGLYVLVIAISGTALLLKSPFYTWFEPKTLVPLETEPLTGAALKERMAEVYVGYELGFTIEGFEEDEATFIVLEKDGEYIPHYFNQYTGEDIGLARPWPIVAVEWVADVHDELMLGRDLGRKINGIGGALFVLMSVTGLLIWWQGKTTLVGRSGDIAGQFTLAPVATAQFFWLLGADPDDRLGRLRFSAGLSEADGRHSGIFR